MKVYVDDIPELMEAARSFTASLGWGDGEAEPTARPDFYEGIDPTLPKWKREHEYIERMREWVRQQRLAVLRQFDLKVLIWLADLDDDEQGRVIWQMFQEGIITDPAKVDDMIADWHASLTPGNAQPTEARKMSDDVLDRWTQYVHIYSDLLDDPDSIWAEEWPDI
jgi:hypothetical protein